MTVVFLSFFWSGDCLILKKGVEIPFTESDLSIVINVFGSPYDAIKQELVHVCIDLVTSVYRNLLWRHGDLIVGVFVIDIEMSGFVLRDSVEMFCIGMFVCV